MIDYTQIYEIKHLPWGMIIWYHGKILGITGSTLPQPFYEKSCYKIKGNKFDYELQP